ncbi:MAG: HAD-IA family hydrolase [Chloroflexota bacterium]|nr:HAD-IA family hydrolase [Chloroflexota bacterium]MDE2908407.1 HAD-IA family hydrolase [Chloroflexota bacterium]
MPFLTLESDCAALEGENAVIYQAILFDLDDTLFSLRGCEAEALQRTLEYAGLLSRLPTDYAERYAAISSAYWAARTTDGYTQYTREQVIELSWRDFLSHHGLDAALSTGLADRFWAEYCQSAGFNPGARETLRRLSLSYRLGIVTNGYSDSQRGRLQAAGLLHVFDPLLISEEVGVAKPDARIFELALTKLRLRPDEVLYVGDSISHDRAGCLRAGIDFCHYRPGGETADPLPNTRYRITELTELISILLPNLTP